MILLTRFDPLKKLSLYDLYIFNQGIFKEYAIFFTRNHFLCLVGLKSLKVPLNMRHYPKNIFFKSPNMFEIFRMLFTYTNSFDVIS